MYLINKRNISLIILSVISFFFTEKYLSRKTDYSLLIASVIIAIQVLSPFFIGKMKSVNSILKMFFLLIISLLILSLFFINKEDINVDRWSVISSFIEEFQKGNYAYLAKSNVGNPPGPLPFYFFLAYPFYFIGELGVYSALGVLLLLLVINKSKSILVQNVLLFMALSSSYIYWEIIVRSAVIINSMMFVFLIYYVSTLKKYDIKQLMVLSLMTGLFMSTRTVLGVVPIFIFVFLLKNRINNTFLFTWVLLSIFIFSLTFVPIVMGHLEEFIAINPFIIQSVSFVPFLYNFVFLGIVIIFAIIINDILDVYFYSGLVLFLIMSIYLVYNVIVFGIHSSFYESRVDISYFLLSIPFFFAYLSMSNSGLKEDYSKKD